MKSIIGLFAILFVVGCAVGLVAGTNDYQFEKQFVLTDSSNAPAIVPDNRIWEIDKLPALDQSGVGTADLSIEGQMYVGSSRDCTIYGKFDIIFSSKQLFPIWLLESTMVKVGDSRDQVTVRQHIVNTEAELIKTNLLNKARAGNTEAQQELAWYYGKGMMGCAYDEEKALYWKCQAELQGKSNALIYIENGDPVKKINCLEIVQKGEPKKIANPGWKPYSPFEK
ncbi:MAG: hypothetical protein WCR06_03875 [bacterium]